MWVLWSVSYDIRLQMYSAHKQGKYHKNHSVLLFFILLSAILPIHIYMINFKVVYTVPVAARLQELLFKPYLKYSCSSWMFTVGYMRRVI